MSYARRTLRLGTRGSLLAVAQSRQVADALERAHPGLRVELKTFSTQGDRDLQTPLTQVSSAAFFSDAVDAALLGGQVDLAVHSRKDLQTPRPAGLLCAAVPARENPRDVLLFRSDVRERLRRGEPLRLGSCSLRRERHVGDFLARHLPREAHPPRLEFRPLRGAVDQRLRYLDLPDDQAEALDGVVLALAGLARLWRSRAGREAVRASLRRARWMVLPLSECPTAPGQGALSIECRRDDARTARLLAPLHDARTAELLEREFAAADGQDERFGATAIRAPRLGALLFTRDAAGRAHLDWSAPARPSSARAWDGGHGASNQFTPVPLAQRPTGAVFAAHWRALPEDWPPDDAARLWVSGVKSWRQLAERGHWVEGCAENLGFASILDTLHCEVLGLPPLADWTALTRRGAESSWDESGVGQILATYTSEQQPAGEDPGLRAATHCFWGSGAQFHALQHLAPPDAEHACGSGKTAEALQACGIEPRIFPSRNAWQAWLA